MEPVGRGGGRAGPWRGRWLEPQSGRDLVAQVVSSTRADGAAVGNRYAATSSGGVGADGCAWPRIGGPPTSGLGTGPDPASPPGGRGIRIRQGGPLR